MVRRLTVIGLLALVVGVAAQTASADPSNAKNSTPVITLVCGSTTYHVVTNGNGAFTPVHVVDSTAVFVPISFDLVFTFTPTGGTTESDHDTSAKANAPANAKVLSCTLPLQQNTFTFPGEGTFTVSGSVVGFFP